MSLTAHSLWPTVRQYVRTEAYNRDLNAAGDVRHRLEIIVPLDVPTQALLLGLTMACVKCGAPITPIRARAGWGTWYLRVTCPGKLACRNSKAAAAEYRAIRDDLAEAPAFPPLPLFEE